MSAATYRMFACLAVCGGMMAAVVSAQSLDRPLAPLAITILCARTRSSDGICGAKSRRRGRLPIPADLQRLIADMAAANRAWAEERIAAELRLKA